jgi:hypothetical protein
MLGDEVPGLGQLAGPPVSLDEPLADGRLE